MYARAAGGIFFFENKAQRSEPFRKKMMPAASPCSVRDGGGEMLLSPESCVRYGGLEVAAERIDVDAATALIAGEDGQLLGLATR